MSDTPTALAIHQEVTACIACAQKISLLHTSKDAPSNFKLLSEPESLEVLGTVNLTKTTLSPFADPKLSTLAHITNNEEDSALLMTIVTGILQTLTSLHDVLSIFTTSTSAAWRDKKIKIFREDFMLRQKLDQFLGLYSNCQDGHNNNANANGNNQCNGDANHNNDYLQEPTPTWLNWITDEEGKQFWRAHFGTKRAASWEAFATALEPSQKPEAPLKDDAFFKSIMDFTHDGYVTAFEFGVFLKWFGPFESCYTRMQETFKSGILCGAVPGVEANMLLEGKPEGYPN